MRNPWRDFDKNHGNILGGNFGRILEVIHRETLLGIPRKIPSGRNPSKNPERNYLRNPKKIRRNIGKNPYNYLKRNISRNFWMNPCRGFHTFCLTVHYLYFFCAVHRFIIFKRRISKCILTTLLILIGKVLFRHWLNVLLFFFYFSSSPQIE